MYTWLANPLIIYNQIYLTREFYTDLYMLILHILNVDFGLTHNR